MPVLCERVRFLNDGQAQFEGTPEDPIDWRNRRATYGDDDWRETAQRVVDILYDRLPICGRTLMLNESIQPIMPSR